MSTATVTVSGTLEIVNGRIGYLRSPDRGYAVRPADPIVRSAMIKRFGLQGGETISGLASSAKRGRGPELTEITTINDRSPDDYAERTPFSELTVIDPRERICFETPGGPLPMRVLDLMTPIGKGQRGLIVAPPRTGKTVLLQQMAAAIATNHPEIHMIVLLIDERPEEVTEMRRAVRGEVAASSKDQDVPSHVRTARLMIEKVKRHVECGREVLILLDSLTRLGRAFNAFVGTSGRTMSGGLDIRAMQEPKTIFGAARNIEHGGSLTIVASALIETGSRMDELIFNEFKGTGNMEILLSRELANKRIWPAVDLRQSGTRKEELLLAPDLLKKSHRLRRMLGALPPDKQMQTLIDRLERHTSNEAFLADLAD